MYCSQNGSSKGRGDSVEVECPRSIVFNKRKRNGDFGMDGGDDDDGWIKKEKLCDWEQTELDFPKWIKEEDANSEGSGNKPWRNGVSTQTEENSRNSNDSTYCAHCTCCRRRMESREISTQTKLRMWTDESESEVDCGVNIPSPPAFPPPLPPTPSPRHSSNLSAKVESAHRKTPHEEEIERQRSVMFAIHKELKMKFESSQKVKVKEEPTPSVLMDDVEEVSISVYSHSLVMDNKKIEEAGTKTGFSSDDTENSGEFPSLEEDRHEKVDSDEKDCSMQDCIGEEFEGAELMSDRTLSDTEFGDISPISFFNDGDGMKFDDKDSSIFSSSVKLKINHQVSGENFLSDSALTISVKSSGSENEKSSDGDIAEKHDLVSNQSTHVSRALSFHVECDGGNQKRLDGNRYEAYQPGSDSAFAPSSDSFSVDEGALLSEKGMERVRRNFVMSSPFALDMNVSRKRVVSFMIEDSKTEDSDTPNGSSQSDDNPFDNIVENTSDVVFLAEREVSCFLVSDSEPNDCDNRCDHDVAGSEVIDLCDSSQDILDNHNQVAKALSRSGSGHELSCEVAPIAHIDTEDSMNCDHPVEVADRSDDSGQNDAQYQTGHLLTTGLTDQYPNLLKGFCSQATNIEEEDPNSESNEKLIESLLDDNPTEVDNAVQVVNVEGITQTEKPVEAECSKLTDGFVDTIDPAEDTEIRINKNLIKKLSELCARVIFEDCSLKILDDKESGARLPIEPNETPNAATPPIYPLAVIGSSDSREIVPLEDPSCNKPSKETAIFKLVNDNLALRKRSLDNIYFDQLMRVNLPNSDVRPGSLPCCISSNSVPPEVRDGLECNMFGGESLNNVQSNEASFAKDCNNLKTKIRKESISCDQDSEDYGYTDDSPYVTKRRPKKKRMKTKSRKSALANVTNSSLEQTNRNLLLSVVS
uniref:Ribonuclease HII n=1 Tax=Lygus hesperus TaxID=30085 RepID=A0A0A9ZGK7_LYGHE